MIKAPEDGSAFIAEERSGYWRIVGKTFFPLAMLIVLTGLLVHHYEARFLKQRILSAESANLDAAVRVINTRLADVASDLRVVAAAPSLARFLSEDSDDSLDSLSRYLQAMVSNKAYYDQARVLNEQGRERVRVNYVNGQALRAAAAELEDKSLRYYFTETMHLSAGRIYISPFDLNVESGQIERPIKPVLRFSTPAFDQSGRKRGMVILNYLGADLRRLVDSALTSLFGRHMLLNADGYWLFSPRPEQEWGFMLNTPWRFQNENPNIWPQFTAAVGQFWQDGALYSYHKISPDRIVRLVDPQRYNEVQNPVAVAGDDMWILMSIVDAADFAALMQPVRRWVMAVCAVLLMLAAGGSWLFGDTRATALQLRRQRERAQRETLEKQRLLELFIRHVPAAVAMLDRQMRYIAVSDRWYQDYRLSESVIGKEHYEVFPETPERWRAIHRQCLAGEVVRCEDDPFPRLDGSIDWLRWEVRPWYDAEGAIGGIIMLTEVITERRKAERIKDEFVAKVSHELRTPMTAIDGVVKLVQGGAAGALDGKQRELFDILARNSDRLLKLINDLLDLERVKLGELRLTFEPVNVVELVHDTVAGMLSLAKSRGVTLDIEDASAGAHVQGDRVRLGQVIDNLLSNALKHAPKDSTVRVRLLSEDERLRVEVRDQGPGVPESFRKQIFSEFAQADQGNTRVPGGSGLGLAISRAIIERHHGQIGYLNLDPRGAMFYFLVPLSRMGEGSTATA